MSWADKLRDKQNAMGLILPKGRMPDPKIPPIKGQITGKELPISSKDLPDDDIDDVHDVVNVDKNEDNVNEENTKAVDVNTEVVNNAVSKIIFDNPKSVASKNDYHALEWGRHRDAGFQIGRRFNSSPCFFTADGHTVHLEDSARGGSIVIIGNNISAESIRLIKIKNQCTFGVDSTNYATTFWSSFKDPSLINIEIINKPNIIKFLPMAYSTLRDKTNHLLHNRPMIFYFRRTEVFGLNFLIEDCVYSMPNSTESVYLSVIKMCYVLGFRKILMGGVNIADNAVIQKLSDLSHIFKANGLNFYTSECNFSVNDIDVDKFLSI